MSTLVFTKRKAPEAVLHAVKGLSVLPKLSCIKSRRGCRFCCRLLEPTVPDVGADKTGNYTDANRNQNVDQGYHLLSSTFLPTEEQQCQNYSTRRGGCKNSGGNVKILRDYSFSWTDNQISGCKNSGGNAKILRDYSFSWTANQISGCKIFGGNAQILGGAAFFH